MASNPKASNAVDRHVGSRIKVRRVSIGISQSVLAEALGLTFQQVQKYEKGINRVGAARLLQTSAALGVPATYFLDGAPNAGDTEEVSHEGRSPSLPIQLLESRDGIDLAEAFLSITDPSVRRTVIELVRHLARQTKREAAE
jgi:transcriptional regulator with XRE-family HTH domain